MPETPAGEPPRLHRGLQLTDRLVDADGEANIIHPLLARLWDRRVCDVSREPCTQDSLRDSSWRH